MQRFDDAVFVLQETPQYVYLVMEVSQSSLCLIVTDLSDNEY